jgi:TusA-related sulfurtransferase
VLKLKYKVVDARGRSCPEPVLMTKNATKDNSDVQVIVDSKVAKENVERFAVNAGYKVDIKEDKDSFILTLKK